MLKNVKIKTVKTSLRVRAYLNSIEPVPAGRDSKLLARLFKKTALVKPRMWGNTDRHV